MLDCLPHTSAEPCGCPTAHTERKGEDMTDTTPENGGAHRGLGKLVDTVIGSPFAGILPWIVMSLFSGPGRFELSVAIAFALSLGFLLISHRHSSHLKPMEVFDLIFFALFFVLGYFVGHSGRTWLENWGGEISNVVLMLFVLITILVKQPFTMPYAKESTDPQYWDTPAFRHINYVISWAWFISFAIQTAMGYYAGAILADTNEFWWGWALPFAPMIAAIVFTEVYPDYARGKARGENPSALGFFEWIAPFALVCGAAGLITDSIGTTVGVILIVGGAVVSGALNRRGKARKATTA